MNKLDTSVWIFSVVGYDLDGIRHDIVNSYGVVVASSEEEAEEMGLQEFRDTFPHHNLATYGAMPLPMLGE